MKRLWIPAIPSSTSRGPGVQSVDRFLENSLRRLQREDAEAAVAKLEVFETTATDMRSCPASRSQPCPMLSFCPSEPLSLPLLSDSCMRSKRVVREQTHKTKQTNKQTNNKTPLPHRLLPPLLPLPLTPRRPRRGCSARGRPSLV